AAVRANFPSAPGQADDDARDFLDIFNHRLLSYFYRGRKKHSIALGADSGAAAPLLERLLFQLIGYNEGVSYNDGTHGHAQVDPRCLLRYAGLLASRERSMAGLEQMLADAFNAPVRGTQQQGCWLALDPRFRTTIGPRGKNQALGHSTVLGKRAWDARGKMTLDIGPLHMARYEALLPGGALHAQLLFMVRFYLREDLDVDVVLHLAAPDEQAAPALGQSRLARNAWLGKGDAARQARSTRFALGRWHP
ncbi:MAG: type VI secretion system baseplate subunit TssG, partial [Massilia sp.]